MSTAATPRPPDAARGDTTALPSNASTNAGSSDRPRLRPIWKLGALCFLAAGFAFGVLEVHADTDTWISLAAGRQIIEDYHFPRDFPRNFPKVDEFSYTFQGRPFFNQNWLSHVYFWLLYDRLGPDWVIIGTWAAAWWMFLGVLLSVRLRCGSWLAGIVAAGIVATASRDWLSARPATIQFACMSTLWLCFAALLGQGQRRRWWPIAVLLGLFALWTHAHGSFVFGFLMVGVFIGCALLVRALTLAGVWRHATVISDRQLIALIVVALLTAALGAALSPYGLENYTHPFKVATSPLFREIGEWTPPYRAGLAFPPTLRFWIALAVAALAPLVAPLLLAWPSLRSGGEVPGLSAPARSEWNRWAAVLVGAVWIAAVLLVTGWLISHPLMRFALTAALSLPALQTLLRVPAGRGPAPADAWLNSALFDVLSLAIGLSMAFFARRFAPVFYLAAAPVLSLATARMAAFLPLPTRRRAGKAVLLAAWVAAAGIGWRAYSLARRDLFERYPSDLPNTLLDRVMRVNTTLYESIEFLRRNEVRANIFTEWTQAGRLMFALPGSRVFIDGRSQQVYDVSHFTTYWDLAGFSDEPRKNPALVTSVLAQSKTDLVLVRRNQTMSAVVTAVADSPEWGLVFAAPNEVMFARLDTPVFQELASRERSGRLWWPGQPYATAARGAMWLRMRPPDLERAAALGRSALEQNPMCGSEAYALVTTALVKAGRADEAIAFLDEERERVTALAGLPKDNRDKLVEELQRCREAVIGFRGRPQRASG